MGDYMRIPDVENDISDDDIDVAQSCYHCLWNLCLFSLLIIGAILFGVTYFTPIVVVNLIIKHFIKKWDMMKGVGLGSMIFGGTISLTLILILIVRRLHKTIKVYQHDPKLLVEEHN